MYAIDRILFKKVLTGRRGRDRMVDGFTTSCAISAYQWRIQGEAHTARAPLKLEKNMIFWRKIVIFHTKYLKNVRASLRNWKKYDFLA